MKLTTKQIFYHWLFSTFIAFYQNKIVLCIQTYSAYDCKGQPRWEVHYNDTTEATKIFQDWLYYKQNNCTGKKYDRFPAPLNGIGSSLQWSIRALVVAIEQDRVYRPNEISVRRVPGLWLWADENASNCTLGIRTVDCYFQPLSICGYEKHMDSISSYDREKVLRGQSNGFKPNPRDTCNIAKQLKKPIQWVQAQYTHYFLRYTQSMTTEINNRISLVIQQKYNNYDNPSEKNTSIIAVQVRGGNPFAFDQRHVLNVSIYIHAVDILAKEMAQLGKPVKRVYLCSHTQEKSIGSIESLNHKYPRSFDFVILPHTSYGEGEEVEFELENRTQTQLKKPPLRQLMMEYLTDLEILANSDAFIGTFSSVYPIVTSLRIAKWGIHFNGSHNCYLDSRRTPPPLLCEKLTDYSEGGKEDIWDYFVGGYNGGSPYWNP